MKITTSDPRRLVPYHLCFSRRMAPYTTVTTHQDKSTNSRSRSMPAIPVLEIPQDLMLSAGKPVSELGDFILYNGHHRRMAALCAGARKVEIVVLETDEDLLINNGKEMLTLSPPSRSIKDHRIFVYNMVLDGTPAALDAEQFVPERPPLFRNK